jgi:hypothetical protein
MMRQLFLSFAAVVLVSAGPANWPIKAACNDMNPPILPCVQAFFGQFGFTNSLPNDTTFIVTLETYLQTNNVAGWTNLQTWMNTFVTCMGGHDNFDACIDWHYLMATCHMSQRDAFAFDGQLRVFEYDVRPKPFAVITANWFCIKGVDQHEGPVVQQCRQHFIDQQHQNPNMTCQNLGEFLNCIERPYATHCGRDVGRLKCHEERIIYTVVNPDCASHVALHCGGAGAKASPPRDEKRPEMKKRWMLH